MHRYVLSCIATQLNDRLATRTYVASDHLSLADLVLYVAVNPAVVRGFRRAHTWFVCHYHESQCTTAGFRHAHSWFVCHFHESIHTTAGSRHAHTCFPPSLFQYTTPPQHGFPAAQTQHFCNLLRWWSFIAHTADANARCPRLRLQLPPFVPPTPPLVSFFGCGDGLVAWMPCPVERCPVNHCPVDRCPVNHCPVERCPVNHCPVDRCVINFSPALPTLTTIDPCPVYPCTANPHNYQPLPCLPMYCQPSQL